MIDMPTCDWSNPGHAPYRQYGDASIVRALDNYDMPGSAKQELLYKIRTMSSDATVFITAKDIHAAFGTAWGLRNMHSSKGVCRGYVDRSNWAHSREEPALVYCSRDNYCVAVPVICGNISQIDYLPHHNGEPEVRGGIVPAVYTVPEPSTMLLVAIACLAIVGRKILT